MFLKALNWKKRLNLFIFIFILIIHIYKYIARRLWRDYFATGVDGVVYIVDAVDRARFPEAKKELDALLTSDELANVPFLILGNKIDLGKAASEDDLRYQLGLFESYGKEVILIYILLIIYILSIILYSSSIAKAKGSKC